LYGFNGGLNLAEVNSILNLNSGPVKGFQLLGVLNINKGNSKGFLVSGVSNICKDSTTGLSVSDVLNYVKGSANGIQVATANIVTNEINGIQLGVINYAKKLKAVQIGVVNIINYNEKAIPIGLFSVVKNGYYEFELTATEFIYAYLNYKKGIEKFYTFYKVGLIIFKNNSVYSIGLGFGSNLQISKKQKICINLTTN
jgi:hypothetical protein